MDSKMSACTGPYEIAAAEAMNRHLRLPRRDEPLRHVVQRMAETGLTTFPVIERDPAGQLVGMISLDDLLKARALNLEAERRRERIMRVEIALPSRLKSLITNH